jgi:hypothetical protein
MQLAGSESIRALTGGCETSTSVRRRRGAECYPAREQMPYGALQMRQCHRCLEDARWERIFAEKFADPSYYTRQITHRASPLTSL